MVNVSVRIVNACQDCSTELTETTFDLEGTVDVGEHKGEGHELNAEEESSERISRKGYFKKGVFVPKGGRFGKMFYGTSVVVRVSCSCGVEGVGTVVGQVTMEDYCQASSMDSMV